MSDLDTYPHDAAPVPNSKDGINIPEMRMALKLPMSTIKNYLTKEQIEKLSTRGLLNDELTMGQWPQDLKTMRSRIITILKRNNLLVDA